MIVITTLTRQPRILQPGDQFHLTVTDQFGASVVISETIRVEKLIDYVASFRFALDDGTVPSFHLMGIFANGAELPSEFMAAVPFENLTPEQQNNFARSCGIELSGDPHQ